MKHKYAEHLRICRELNAEPEPLESFLRDFIDYPDLLTDNDTIVFRDEIKSASPLTWAHSFGDIK